MLKPWRKKWRKLWVGSTYDQKCYYCEKIIPARTPGTWKHGHRAYGVTYACSRHDIRG